jgi:HlyD family secretion protein
MTAYVQITANKRDKVLRVTNAALRFRPPAEPGKESEKAAAGPGAGGGGARGPGGGGGRREAPQQRVYKLVDGKPVAIPVKGGISDSTFTEILDGDVKEGDKLVTRDLAAASGAGAQQPQMRMRMF